MNEEVRVAAVAGRSISCSLAPMLSVGDGARAVELLRGLIHGLLCAARLRRDAGTWVLPGEVVACAYPRTEAALAALRLAGVRHIVNLHTRTHRRCALERHGMRETHLPTPDFAAPAPAALREGVRSIEQSLARGSPVAVHCGGGRGRTGTLLACLLVARGHDPAEAVAEVRRARPGAVETRGQEAAVHAFAASRAF